MSRHALIEELEEKYIKQDIPSFKVGDTLKVHLRIIEGDKERVQVFTGTVIARKGGGLSETFSLYRVAYGAGMERVFLLHSPRIAKIEVVRCGDVRRAKLYYLRGKTGKASKVKEKIGTKKTRKATVKAASSVEENNEATGQQEVSPEEPPKEES